MHLRLALAASILVLSAGCGSMSSPAPSPSPSPTPSPTASGTAASIVSGATSLGSNAYAPNPINVAVGGTVTWTNNDTVTHTSTSNTGAWNSGSMAPGANFSMTFTSAGSYAYHCAIHPGMIGTVNVQ